MAPSVDALKSIAQSLQVVRDGPAEIQPGQKVTVRLEPAASGLKLTDALPGSLDLLFLTKDIRFNNRFVEPVLDAAGLDPKIVNGQPITGLTGSIGSVTDVPGTLGQVSGSVPIPVEVPVGIQVKWAVLDEAGNELAEGADFVAPDGLGSPEVSFIFPLQVVELTSLTSPPLPVTRFIRAKVLVSAGGTTIAINDPANPNNVADVTLPDVPVIIAALAVPTLLALFLHTNFAAADGDDDGAVLIVVPAASPLRSFEQVQPLLNTLESTVSSLTSFANFASFLLGLHTLNAALAAQPHVQFRAADRISNLNDITLIQRGIFSNDTEAEDELSSLIFIGPPGKTVQCFNARNTSSREGQFDLTIARRVVEGTEQIGAELFTLIRSLHSPAPASEPTGQEINVVRNSTESNRFGDELSSLQFP
jgi:hypothetical protein